MAKRFLILLLLLFPFMAGAADEAAVSDLADRVQKLYEGAQDLSMDFGQKTYVAVLEKEPLGNRVVVQPKDQKQPRGNENRGNKDRPKDDRKGKP